MSLVTQMVRDLEGSEDKSIERGLPEKKTTSEMPLFAAANLLYGKHHQPTAKRARLILAVFLLMALVILLIDRVLLPMQFNHLFDNNFNEETHSIEKLVVAERQIEREIEERQVLEKVKEKEVNENPTGAIIDSRQNSLLEVNEISTIGFSKPAAPAIKVDERPVVKKPRQPSPEEIDLIRYEKALSILTKDSFDSAINYLSKNQPQTKENSSFKSTSLYISLLIEGQIFLEAENVLAIYQAEHPRNRIFLKLKIRLAIAQKDYPLALNLLDQQIIKASRDSEFTEFRAIANQAQSRFTVAEENYKQLLRLDNRPSRWWMGLAIALDAQAKFGDAAQAYRQVLLSSDLSAEHDRYASQRINRLSDFDSLSYQTLGSGTN